MNNNVSIAVVLLNWNGIDLTIPCIESLLEGSYRPDNIIVVDNASEDNSIYEINRMYPSVNIIRSEVNVGFAAGNNIGISVALQEGYDYIWVLNNDTVVDKYCLEYILKAMSKDKDIAACTGKILYENQRNKIWYAGSYYNKWTLKAKHRGQLEVDSGKYDNPEDVPFISGCCLFARRQAFIDVGVLDERFFAYSEDLDWCIRSKKAGLILRYIPKAIIYHKVSASFQKIKSIDTPGSTSPFIINVIYKGRIMIIRKHVTNVFQFIVAACMEFISIMYYSIGLTLLGRFNKLSSLWGGVFDGFKIKT